MLTFAALAWLGFLAMPQTASADQTSTEPASSDLTLGDLDHTKTVTKKDGDTDQYTLNLNVTGKTVAQTITGDKPKVDVTFVIDTSGSMSDNNRLQTVKTAITGSNGMADALFDGQLDTQATVISFATEAKDPQTYTTGQSDDVRQVKNQFNNAINTLQAQGGTRWDLALQAANKITPREGATHYVIFLTDGQPGMNGWAPNSFPYVMTYIPGWQVYENSLTSAQNLVQQGWNVINVGVDMPDDVRVNPSAGAADVCEESRSWLWGTVQWSCPTNSAGYYADSTRNANWNKWVSPLQGLTDHEKSVMQENQDIEVFPNITTNEIGTVFTKLKTTVTMTSRKAASAVVIRDTVSKWVDPVGIETDAQGNVTSGVSVIRSDTQAAVDANNIKSITYANRTVTVTFADEFELDNNVTYSVQYDIEPSQAAYEQAAQALNSGKRSEAIYPQTATNGVTEANSAEPMHGFYANDNATLDYRECLTVDGVQQGCTQHAQMTYTHPVTQVHFAAATFAQPLNARAEVKGSRGWVDGNEFTATMSAVDGAPEPAQATVSMSKAAPQAQFGNVTFTEPGTYRYTVQENADSALPYTFSKAVYTVTVQVAADAASRALVATTEIEQTANDNGQHSALGVQSNVMTFTNTNGVTTLSADALTVSKAISGANWKSGDKFHFLLTAVSEAAPVPCAQSPCVAQITSESANHETNFGQITYDTPGTYEYRVTERDDNQAGFQYSQTSYIVHVTVTQDGGNLVASQQIEQERDDGGTEVTGSRAVQGSMHFTNAWIQVSVLPLTGSGDVTPRTWILAATGIGVLALLLGIGTVMVRNRHMQQTL